MNGFNWTWMVISSIIGSIGWWMFLQGRKNHDTGKVFWGLVLFAIALCAF